MMRYNLRVSPIEAHASFSIALHSHDTPITAAALECIVTCAKTNRQLTGHGLLMYVPSSQALDGRIHLALEKIHEKEQQLSSKLLDISSDGHVSFASGNPPKFL